MTTKPTTAPYVRGSGTRPDEMRPAATMTWLATGADTAGQLAVAEVCLSRGQAPAPHIHQCEDQAYVVLEGRITVLAGTEILEAGPGDFVWLPRHLEHGYRIVSDEVRLLVLLTPAEGGEAPWSFAGALPAGASAGRDQDHADGLGLGLRSGALAPGAVGVAEGGEGR